MNSAIILACTVLCAVLGVLLLRAHSKIQKFEDALLLANETQRTNDTLLTQRSELDIIKDEFISTVSHELRTPLTSIRGALGLLSAGIMGNVDAKAHNLLRIALTNTDRLIRLINDILDLERMQSGRSPLLARRCSLRDLVHQAVETMTPMADAAGVKLQPILAAPAETVFFDGDPDRILQILTNLLSNAIKFSPDEGIVEIRIEANPDSVLLRVSDQGRGIPVDKLDFIFDRFHQLEPSDARQKGGTGLGLAICRTIVQQHNGSIWAESNVEQNRGPGSSLVVALPRISRVQDASILQPGLVAPATDKGVILICDDDANTRTIVAKHLIQNGYKMLEAATGEEAIQIANAQPVDAILLDLCMPDLSGWETLERLKHVSATANIPVIILSVLSPLDHSVGEHRIAAQAAQGWIQKPFFEPLLLAELARALHIRNRQANVLLVEDDSDLASVVIAGFDKANVHVDHAETRQKAIERCLLARPDLLILDLTLPDGDGFSLVEWLREQPDLRSLPLVVYSGRDLSESDMAKLRLGPTQFLSKTKVQPHEVETFVLNIVHHLHGSELRSAC